MAGTVTEKGPAYSLLDAKVLIVEGTTPAIVAVDLFYAREVAINPQITTLTFEGDDTSQQIDQLARVEGTLSCDKLDLAAVQRIYAKTRVTTISGESASLWMGDNAEVAGVAAGLQYDIAFKDESVTPYVFNVVRYTFPRGTIKVVRPQNATSTRPNSRWCWASRSRRPALICSASALTGVPSGGAVYRIGKLT